MFNRPLEHRQLAGISAPATSCLTNAELQRTRRHVRAAQPARNSILLSHAHSPQSFVFKAALTPRKAQVSCNPLQQVLFFFLFLLKNQYAILSEDMKQTRLSFEPLKPLHCALFLQLHLHTCAGSLRLPLPAGLRWKGQQSEIQPLLY